MIFTCERTKLACERHCRKRAAFWKHLLKETELDWELVLAAGLVLQERDHLSDHLLCLTAKLDPQEQSWVSVSLVQGLSLQAVLPG